MFDMFDIIYVKVLRTYYLLFPIMNTFIKLNEGAKVAKRAGGILHATDPSQWMPIHYMPRTRDMSQSRWKLLQA